MSQHGWEAETMTGLRLGIWDGGRGERISKISTRRIQIEREEKMRDRLD
jgi:hypothetical protein